MRVPVLHVVRAASLLASACRPEIGVLDCLEPQEASPLSSKLALLASLA